MSGITRLDNFDGNSDYGDEFMLLYSLEAITSADWVAFVAADTASPGGAREFTIQAADSDDADGPANVCGVATETTTAAGMVRVQIAGRHAAANVASTVVEGEALVASATAGQAQDANQVSDGVAQLNYRHCGIALTTASSNLSAVRIIRHPKFAR